MPVTVTFSGENKEALAELAADFFDLKGKEKRTRRSKEQIEADKKKAEDGDGDSDGNDAPETDMPTLRKSLMRIAKDKETPGLGKTNALRLVAKHGGGVGELADVKPEFFDELKAKADAYYEKCIAAAKDGDDDDDDDDDL